MRHLLVLAIAAIWLVPGTGGAMAQEATPAAAVERTNIRYFLPYTPDGLASGLTVTGEVSGVCLSSSLADIGRPDAWVCTEQETSERYDPCFENPFGPIDEPAELVCIDSPFSTEVVRFTLTEPLQRSKDVLPEPDIAPIAEQGPPIAPAPPPMSVNEGYAEPMPAPIPAPIPAPMPAPPPLPAEVPGDIAEVAIDPLDIPWALELANGERCTLLTGATAVLAGQRINFGCEGGGSVLGEVDRSGPVWSVSYLAPDALASELVAVSVVWT